MTLLERGFPGIVESSSGPRPGVKDGSAFGRSYEERSCSNEDKPGDPKSWTHRNSGLVHVNDLAS